MNNEENNNIEAKDEKIDEKTEEKVETKEEVVSNNNSDDNKKIIIYFIGLILCISVFVVSIKLFGNETISFSKEKNSEEKDKSSYSYEDSKKGFFADIAKVYINAVRNGMLAAEFKCSSDENKWEEIDYFLPDDKKRYYFMIDTGNAYNKDKIKQSAQINTSMLLESGGKSPFERGDLIGYVMWETVKVDGKINRTYKIKLVDEDRNGLKDATLENDLSKKLIVIGSANYEDKPRKDIGYTYYRCIFK